MVGKNTISREEFKENIGVTKMNKKQNSNTVKIVFIVIGIIIILFLTNVIIQSSTGKSLIELIFEPKENSENIEPCGTPVPSKRY